MSLFHAGLQPALDGDGNPISGATWTFYLTETLTPTPVYSNEALSVSLGSSETSDADGRFPNPMFLDDAILTRAILRDAGGTTIEDIDPVNAEANAGATSFLAYVPRSLAQYQQNGETDQQAFEAAITAMIDAEGPVQSGFYPEGAGLFIPEGVYTLTGPLDISNATGTANVHIWAVPGTVKINLAAGEYMLDCDDYMSSIDIYGINTNGGKGLIRQQDTSINVNAFRRVEKCQILNFTEAAIVTNASDDPYWKIRDNVLFGATGSDTRGVVLGGLSDDAEIANNTFLKNQYHIVMGPIHSGNVYIKHNSFLSFVAAHCDADIVFIANDTAGQYGSNSGQVVIVEANKFGNENLNPTAPRILFSSFNTGSGTGRENHPISTTWTAPSGGANYITGIQFKANRWVQDGLYAAPLMRSYIEQVNGVLFDDDNEFDGGRPTYLIEWMGATREPTYTTKWDVRFGAYSEFIGSGSPFVTGISNYPIGPVEDRSSLLVSSAHSSVPWAPPTGGETTLLYADADADWTVFSSATKTASTNADGASTATQVTAASANNIALYAALADATGNTHSTVWLVGRVRGDATRSISRLKIELYNATSTRTALVRNIKLRNGWDMICCPVQLSSENPTAWQLRFTPLDYTVTTADRFHIGNWHIHTGAMPLRAPPATLLADPAGGATVDAEARTAINALIDALQVQGLMKVV